MDEEDRLEKSKQQRKLQQKQIDFNQVFRKSHPLLKVLNWEIERSARASSVMQERQKDMDVSVLR